MNRVVQSVVILVLLAIFSVATYGQSTLNVPEDYPTIQAAIDVAPEGALLCLAEGEWVEELAVAGQSLCDWGATCAHGPTTT